MSLLKSFEVRVREELRSVVDTHYLKKAGAIAADLRPGNFPVRGLESLYPVKGAVTGTYSYEGLEVEITKNTPEGQLHQRVGICMGELATPLVGAVEYSHSDGSDVLDRHYPPLKGEDVFPPRDIYLALKSALAAQNPLLRQPATA